ncbi:hypothetical protein [Mycolicibacter minnesotensis]
MTSPAVRATPVSLRKLALRCAALSNQVAPELPAVSVSPWQASGNAANTVNARGRTASEAMQTRMTANGSKLIITADQYEAMDRAAADKLSQVPMHAGSPATARGPGADGGAGGSGMPR